MRKLIASAVLALGIAVAGNGYAVTINVIQNGDFETGGGSLTGWSTSGATGLYTETGSGNHMATLGRGSVGGDALISQAFVIGDLYFDQTLAFDYQFAFVDQSQHQLDIFAAIVNGNEQVHLASYDTTAWVSVFAHHEALLIPQLAAGTYALMFKLTEASGTNTDSFVKFDNVALTARVPEPGTLLLLGSGLLGMAAFGRRRFNK